MNTFYTPEIKQYVHTRNWPKGLQFDVTEDLVQGCLYFVFYRDNFVTFGGEEQLQIAMTVKEVMESLRAKGVPCYMAKLESRRGQH